MQAIDMKKLYSDKKYKGNWVTLKSFKSNPEVISFAKTLKQALKEAEVKGYKHPVIMQIPNEVLPIVGIL